MENTDPKANDYTELSSDDEAYNDIEDDDEEIGEDDGEQTTCLFCTQVAKSIDVAIDHLNSQHNVNLSQLKQKFQMDQYAFIKLINYIRIGTISAEQLLLTEQPQWNDEKYLKPLAYEPWLCYDYESLKTDGPEEAAVGTQELMQRLAEQGKLLQQASEDMERMRNDYKALLQKVHSDTDIGDKDDMPGVVRNSKTFDKEYFNSYSHFGIHLEMLSDKVRTSSYREALMQNEKFLRGKTVLDVGCGTGILSIFASQAGAESVVGIDNSKIVYTAMDIVRKNQVQNVKLIKGRLEDTELPEPKYDIIISEWMGYFLLYEAMLDSIIYARDHHLKPNGKILPNRCTLHLLGINEELHGQHVEFWSDVYGVNMSDLRKRSIEEPLMQVVNSDNILTETELIADFDMMTVDLNYSNFQHEFNLKCTETGKLGAFAGYFDTFFDLDRPVMFSTSPTATPTHWKQTVFFIDQPQDVQKGQVISGKIRSRRHQGDVRALCVDIEVFGRHYKYTVD
ncbi:protein arginine N-methyltransferase 1 [Drosophila grimshawi]|uniref:type I protein arginine methyltransferase n=1 Tax=Drosophila grimshawi TaxID=7222 RepID=B4JGB6_DROGR|nr:protein arginine N-methyltransferase 1 [Drosophila grimshawi]EDV92585.1 GH18753 [Drosophila grimshawi]